MPRTVTFADVLSDSRRGWCIQLTGFRLSSDKIADLSAARLAVAAPWLMLAMLSLRPEAVAAYNSPTGVLVLGGGGVTSLVAYRLMRRIARLPQEQRVLR